MTLEEKVGQMTQVTLGVIAAKVVNGEDGNLDPVKLKTAVATKVGSILNVNERALTAEKWRSLVTQIQDEVKNTRLQIPVVYGLDGIHGETPHIECNIVSAEYCDGSHP